MSGNRTPEDCENSSDHAVQLIRDLPLAMSGSGGAAGIDLVLDRGWFEGPEECARILGELVPCERVDGWAFGGPWPLLVAPTWTMAPAVPLVVGSERVAANDGEYWRAETTIWREACGVEAPYLCPGENPAVINAPFELVWFGPSERFTVRAGFLEVEDLFGVLRAPAERAILQRLLIREKRFDAAILDTIDGFRDADPQTVEVRRPSVLVDGDCWRDPTAMLAARTDIDSVRRVSGKLEVRDVAGTAASFAVDESDHSWQMTLVGGDFLYTGLRLTRSKAVTSLEAILAPRIDGLAPGMRQRLIFDLRSSLVSLDWR